MPQKQLVKSTSKILRSISQSVALQSPSQLNIINNLKTAESGLNYMKFANINTKKPINVKEKVLETIAKLEKKSAKRLRQMH